MIVYQRCRIGPEHTGVSKDRHWPYFMTSASKEKHITASYQSRCKSSTMSITRPTEQDADVHHDDDYLTAND